MKVDVKVSDTATGMSVTYWQVPEDEAEAVRKKATDELYWRKHQLSKEPSRVPEGRYKWDS